ncbi:Cytochrome P450 [Novosphingobium sp. CF614]|uniref:cytochrome P450 n=1 Tax=Novosphingobium sp. CF614 TaxID=1884364 RepID=UPI0008F01FB3|nr:cytochrome P450 [Novosphingobium sp. CF614]SFF96922.1 Cytochrome P450 [Novosphingobium sp. CF614]
MTQEPLPYPFAEPTRLDVDPRYEEIRKQGIVRVQLPYGEPTWLITSVADARIAYDFRKFGRTEGLKHAIPGLHNTEQIKIPSLLLHMDPPEHTRIRQLAAGAFSPDRIQKLSEWVQGIVDELFDAIEAEGPGADFIKMYSHVLPVRVLAGVLGIPKDKAFEFKQWIDISSDFNNSPEVKLDARTRTLDFIRDLIAQRREKPEDDLLSVLVHARDNEDKFEEDELVSLAMALWHGGFKTTLWQLSTTVFTLMTHPDHWRELKDKPEIMNAALNELWRWIPSFKYGVPFGFWAKEDVTFTNGQVVKKNEPVLVEFAVVNRDNAVWPDADKLDFHRVKPPQHYAFTAGAHSCVGQHLAKLQIRLTVETLIRRFPTLELAIPAEDVAFDPASFMRSILSLPIKW